MDELELIRAFEAYLKLLDSEIGEGDGAAQNGAENSGDCSVRPLMASSPWSEVDLEL